MPIRLTGGSISAPGLRLVGGPQIEASFSVSSPIMFSTLTASNINISAALTEVMNIDVPSGQALLLKDAKLYLFGSGGSVNTGQITYELEIDGVIICSATNKAVTSTAMAFIGLSGNQINDNAAVMDIAVTKNLKLRARHTAVDKATFTISYARVSV